MALSSRSNNAGLAAAIATIATVGMGFSLSLPLLALVLENRQETSTTIGLNSAMAGVAAVALAPLAPRLLRILPAAPLTIALVLINAISFLGFWVFDDMAIWYGLRFVFHGAITLLFVISEYWIIALAPAARRGLIMGIYATVLSAGFMLGPLILGIIGSAGFAPFATGSTIMAAGALPVLLAWRQSPPRHDKNSPSFMRMLVLVPSATFAGFVFGFAESGEFAFMALYGLRNGLSEQAAAGLIAAIAGGGILFLIPLGMLTDRMDPRFMLLACAMTGVACMGMLPLVIAQPIAPFVLLAIHGGVTGAIYAAGLTLLGARLQTAQLAAANAGFVFMYACGMLIGPAMTGFIGDYWDPTGIPATFATAFGIYALIVIMRMIRRPPTKTPPLAVKN